MAAMGKEVSGKKEGETKSEEYEFGGPVGAIGLMVWSHYILIYFWYCLEFNSGQMIIPTSLSDLLIHTQNVWGLIMEKGIPSQTMWIAYFAFFFVQILLASFMPGITTYGLPTAPNGERLPYLCNGYACYYLGLLGLFAIHYFDIFPITYLADNYGQALIASILIADATSVFWYVFGLLFAGEHNGKSTRTGNVIYDFFIGTILYPRIGVVDIKMIAECRWSWTTLFILTLSFAVKQYETIGYVSLQMCTMLFAHWLYSNATAKGEHCIPCTWDMFHEKFGWMLNFWNVCGVPFLYCFQSQYILKNQAAIDEHGYPIWLVACVFTLLVTGYYIFDTANSQKATVKVRIYRNTFPQLPWAILEEPFKYINTPKGNLLVDGWYAYARKMQYTGDIMMALSWGLSCGFLSSLPYFYPLFFVCMIVHRQSRDEARCKEKYGEYWDVYTKQVPNVFIPSMAFFVELFSGSKAGSTETSQKKTK